MARGGGTTAAEEPATTSTTILDAFEDHLAGLTYRPALAAVVDLLVSETRPAALWRRVILAGVKNPLLAAELAPLISSRVAMTAADLWEPLVDLLAAIHRQLPPEQRAAVDAEVKSLRPAGPDDGSWGWHREDVRYRQFLHVLHPDTMLDPDLRDQRKATSRPSLPNTWAVGDLEESNDSWERYGIRTTTDDDRDLTSLLEALKELNDEHRNSMPPPDDVDRSVALADQILAHLANAGLQLSPEVRDLADETLAEAVEQWTRTPDLDHSVQAKARGLLLGLANHPRPLPSTHDNERVAIIPPGPRGPVTRGLLQLARRSEHADAGVLEEIATLANDPVPWVRISVARGLVMLRTTAPTTMWVLLRHIADNDEHDGVLRAAARTATALRQFDPDAAIDIARRIAARATRSDEHDSALEACAEVAALGWVFSAQAAARSLLDSLTHLQTHPVRPLIGLLHEIRASGAHTHDDEAIRQRALQLCEEFAELGFAQIGDPHELSSPQDEATTERIEGGARLLDAVASQLHFASGSFEVQLGHQDELTPAQQRFVDEALPLLIRLGEAPFPPITHRLIQTFEHVLDSRPEPVLLAMHAILVTGGRAGGYQYDHLAVDTAVGIVEKLLADHRNILQQPQCLTALRELLDVFVEAGWSSAHRLVYRLEDIFR